MRIESVIDQNSNTDGRQTGYMYSKCSHAITINVFSLCCVLLKAKKGTGGRFIY